VRAFELGSSDADRFVDDDGSVHEPSIDALAQAGITVGCGPDIFCPDDPVRRHEMATFLTRALQLDPIVPEPGFYASISEIDSDLESRMTSSWRDGCPVSLSDLRYLELDHWGFDGRERRGELVVHHDHAEDIVAVFRALFDSRFPIERMRLVDEYGGDDLASMNANNTSAFNCRAAQGSASWSEHAFGRAIDINPIQNPYLRGSVLLPPAGAAFVDRSLNAPGMIHAGDVVVEAFDGIGWPWGGDWITLKDWQHFSSTGR
jgi:hypothetical protein